MKYTKKILEDKRIETVLNMDKKEWEDALTEAYNKNKGKYSVQGFRAGHAPRKVIEKNYGDTVFFDDAINNCFYKYYFEFLSKEKDVEPVAMPEITVNKIDDNGLELVLKITNKPEVTLGAYKGLTIAKEKATVSGDEVEHELLHLRESRVKYEEVKRPVKSGDMTTIDFSGIVDGVKFEGGTATDYDLEIGSQSFIDTFEDQLIGLKKGDKKDVLVTFPENYQEEKLKGKKAKFEVTIKAIKEKHLPELNDAFADDVSEFSTLEELKADTKRKLLENKTKEEKSKSENKLIDLIVDESKMQVPEVMVEAQIEDFIHDFEHRLSHQGLTLDGYLKFSNMTLEVLKNSRREDARKTVKTRLVLEKIIENEKITVTDKDAEEKYNEFNKDGNKKSIAEIKKIMGEEQYNYYENSLLLNKLMKFLISNNNLSADIKEEVAESTANKTTKPKTTAKKTAK
ncbi:MAG: trigger factor [Clostridia bacterium]|nr:trigger factor [Clostridia bacterium]